MMSENRFDAIIQYLSGAMSHEEKTLFEKEMAADNELDEDVKLVSEIRDVMRQSEKYGENDWALAQSLAKLNETFFKSDDIAQPAGNKYSGKRNIELHKKSRIKWMTNPVWLAVAAVLIGIIVFSAIWFVQKDNNGNTIVQQGADTIGVAANTEPDNRQKKDSSENNTVRENVKDTSGKKINTDDLFADNFRVDKIPAKENQQGLDLAFNYFEKKDYGSANDAFALAKTSSLTRGDETDSVLVKFYVDYYTGQALMDQGKISKAIPQLQNAATEINDDYLKAKAQWYLSLAYIKEGKITKALNTLKPLSENSKAKEYKTRAADLIKALGQ